MNDNDIPIGVGEARLEFVLECVRMLLKKDRSRGWYRTAEFE